MKKNQFGAVVFVALCLFMLSVGCACACPFFVEFFPDPKDVPDQEGEFVEIRLDEFRGDSLVVQMDDKSPLSFAFPKGKRFVLVHDSAYCPSAEDVACGLLGKLSLPNSRESVWRLRSKACADSVILPTPKAGYALQRVKSTDRWEMTVPTMGFANPAYEDGVADCGIAPVERELASVMGKDSVYRYSLYLTGCDSAKVWLKTVDLNRGQTQEDSVFVKSRYRWESSASALWIQGRLPPDEAPGNNSIDTMMVASAGGFPLAISEIHHCPQEPEPEWVEVYNRSSQALPLDKFRFCNRGGTWGAGSTAASSESVAAAANSAARDAAIQPYESIILTKDTAQLREVLGFKDVRLLQVALGFLNNTAGCLSICSGESVIDSACWERHTVTCPAGFNPLTMAAENTPGFLLADISGGRGSSSAGGRSSATAVQTPFAYKLSSRVLRVGGNPLRVYVEGNSSVTLRLLDSAGREQWHAEVPAQTNAWWNVPLGNMPIGVAYVSFSAGKFENVVGILIRP